jgi:hypothetical protein
VVGDQNFASGYQRDNTVKEIAHPALRLQSTIAFCETGFRWSRAVCADGMIAAGGPKLTDYVRELSERLA